MAIKHSAITSRKDMVMVNPSKIKVLENWNPRTEFETDKLLQLKNSIIANGVLVPIRVKINKDGEMVLIDGERRLRATLEAIKDGYEIVSIPAIIERKTMKESDMLCLAMTTNTGIKLTPFEEAKAIQRLLNYGMNLKEISTKLGHSVQFLKSRLKLNDATPETIEMLNKKEINLSDAIQVIDDSCGETEEQNKKAKIKSELKKSNIKKASRKQMFELLKEIYDDLEAFEDMPQIYSYRDKIGLIIEKEKLL